MDQDIAHELGFLLGEHNQGRADLTKRAADDEKAPEEPPTFLQRVGRGAGYGGLAGLGVGGATTIALLSPKVRHWVARLLAKMNRRGEVTPFLTNRAIREQLDQGLGTALPIGGGLWGTIAGAVGGAGRHLGAQGEDADQRRKVKEYKKRKDWEAGKPEHEQGKSGSNLAPMQKDAWLGTALMIGSIAAPYIQDWWANRQQQQQGQNQLTPAGGAAGQPGAAGAMGYGQQQQPQQQQSYFGFRPTSTRQVAQPAYQFGERMASSAATGLVKAALVKVAQGFAFPGAGPGGAYAQPQRRRPNPFVQFESPNVLHGGQTGGAMTYLPEAAMAASTLGGGGGGAAGAAGAAGATGGGGTTGGGRGGADRIRRGPGPQTTGRKYRAAAARTDRMQRFASKYGQRAAMKRFGARAARGGLLSRLGGAAGATPWTAGRAAKWGLGALALGLAAPHLWRGAKGAWHGIMGTTPDDGKLIPAQGGPAGGGQKLYSDEERRQFARLGIDPRQMFAARDAAGALQGGAMFRRAQEQNWLRAANAMMLTGGLPNMGRMPASQNVPTY